MVLWPLWVLNKTRCTARHVLYCATPFRWSCPAFIALLATVLAIGKAFWGRNGAERELGHPAQSPRFAAAPRRAEVGTACDRVARIRCHSIAPEEIYEILRVLLVREDSAEPRL